MRRRKVLCGLASTLVLPCATLCMTGCREADGNDRTMAEQLFAKSERIVRMYTDSVRNVRDSASLHRMEEGVNARLSNINYQFPSDTDLRLTEEENDSLIKLMDRLTSLINEKHTQLELLAEGGDSIPIGVVSPVSK